MSWSVTVIGKPDKVVEQLSTYSGSFGNPQSNQEYEEARPHLQGLVSLCVGSDLLINLSANGHADFDADSKKTYGNVQVSLQQFYAKLVL